MPHVIVSEETMIFKDDLKNSKLQQAELNNYFEPPYSDCVNNDTFLYQTLGNGLEIQELFHIK